MDESSQLVFTDGGQSGGGHATALGAVGIAAELAWSDAGGEVGGNAGGGLREDAIFRGGGRFGVAVEDGGRHVHFGKEVAEAGQFGDHGLAIEGSEALGALLSLLRCKEAEPDVFNLRLARPEIGEFAEIARALDLRTGNSAMDGDLMSGNVFENAIVSCGRTPRVVLGLQAIYGDDQMKIADGAPFERNGANSAGDELDFDIHGCQLGEDDVQFAIANQRLPTDDGQMQGFDAANERENGVDQGVATIVTELAQRANRSQVVRLVSVTAGTAERAFLGDFERKKGFLSAKNFAPGRSDVLESHEVSSPFDAGERASAAKEVGKKR